MKVRMKEKAFVRGHLMKKGTVLSVPDDQFDARLMLPLEAPKPVETKPTAPKKD